MNDSLLFSCIRQSIESESSTGSGSVRWPHSCPPSFPLTRIPSGFLRWPRSVLEWSEGIMTFTSSSMVSRLLCILCFYNLSERVTEDLLTGIIKSPSPTDKHRYMYKLVHLKPSIFMILIRSIWKMQQNNDFQKKLLE